MAYTVWKGESDRNGTRLTDFLPRIVNFASLHDKTGANGEHTSNDIAILWPTGQLPIIVTAYITQCTGPEGKRAAILAKVGELVRDSIG